MVQQRTTEGTATRWNNGTIGGSKCTNHNRPLCYKWYRAISRPYHLKKTSSKQSKRRDLHLKWLHRDTNDNTLYYKSLYGELWLKYEFVWRSGVDIEFFQCMGNLLNKDSYNQSVTTSLGLFICRDPSLVIRWRHNKHPCPSYMGLLPPTGIW